MLRTRLWQVAVVAVIIAAAIVFAVPNLFNRASLESYPTWLPSSQVNLGLDLQGGSHLLLEVQVGDILRERITTLVDDTRVALRRNGIKYTGLKAARDRVLFQLIDPGQIDVAEEAVEDLDPEAEIDSDSGGAFQIVLTEEAVEGRRLAAVNQSIEIIRRRIDETGVREPTIQRQGEDRILVQLPGVDDPERIKRLLGRTAKLTFHLLDENVTPADRRSGRVPLGSLRLPGDELDAEGEEIFYVIRKRVMVSGDSLVDAATTRDQTGQWAVSFRFDSTRCAQVRRRDHRERRQAFRHRAGRPGHQRAGDPRAHRRRQRSDHRQLHGRGGQRPFAAAARRRAAGADEDSGGAHGRARSRRRFHRGRQDRLHHRARGSDRVHGALLRPVRPWSPISR